MTQHLVFQVGNNNEFVLHGYFTTSPKVILLDEPTSALDPISAGKIEETLYNLKDQYTFVACHTFYATGKHVYLNEQPFSSMENLLSIHQLKTCSLIHNTKKPKITLPVS